MKFSARLTVAILIVALFPLARGRGLVAQQDLLELEEQALWAAVARVAPSVVRIETVGGLERVDELTVPAGPTTGVIVSSDGYIVSSAFNFVQQPSSILVTLDDGTRAAARLVSRDASRMLVLLKVNVARPLPVPEAAPRQEWFVGQWCVAVGRTYPGNLPNVSMGILSARDRIWGKAVQTDAKISPANYGGPLVDIHGRVIGVLVPLSPQGQDEVAGVEWYDSGIGFAVPLVDILARLDTWKQGQDLHPGLLGIAFQDRNELLGEPVLGVVRVNSPAETAGLRAGDRITHVNGRQVRRIADVKHVLGPLYAGDRVEVTVLRDGQPLTVSATLVEKLIPYAHAVLGVLPETVTTDVPGVPIRWVMPGSSAHAVNIRAGDRIVRFEGEPVSDLARLRQLMLRRQPGQTVAMQVDRQGQTVDLEKVELMALPDQIPDQVPVRSGEPSAGSGAEARFVDVQVPEEPNECRLWLPSSFDPQKPYGLLVWFQTAGQYDPDAVVAHWSDVCRHRQMLLLLPKSREPTGWRPTEIEFVRKAIELVAGQYRLDAQRIVVGGEEFGASMAYLVAFSLRQQVRGLLVTGAGLPLRLKVPDNDPLYRLSILLIVPASGRMKTVMTETAEKLRQMRFPVTVVSLSESQPSWSAVPDDLLGRWLEILDLL